MTDMKRIIVLLLILVATISMSLFLRTGSAERIVLETINGTTIYPYQSLKLKVWVFDPKNQVVYAGGNCNVTIWNETDLIGFYKYPGIRTPLTLSIQFNSTGQYIVDIYCVFPDLNTTYHKRVTVNVVFPPVTVESDVDWGIWPGIIYLKVPYDLNGWHGVARIGANYYHLYWRHGVSKIYIYSGTSNPIDIDLRIFGHRTFLRAYPRIHPPTIILDRYVSHFIRYDNVTNTFYVSPLDVIVFRILDSEGIYPHPYPVVEGTCRHMETYFEAVFFAPDPGEGCTGRIVFKWWDGEETIYTVRLVTPAPRISVKVSDYNTSINGVVVRINTSSPYVFVYRLNVSVRTMNGSLSTFSIIYSGNGSFTIPFDRQPPKAFVRVTVSSTSGKIVYDKLFVVRVPRFETHIPPPVTGNGFCDEMNLFIPDYVASRIISLGERLILYEYFPGNLTHLPSILVTILKPYHPSMYVDSDGNLVFRNLPPGTHIVIEWGTGYIERLVTRCTDKLVITPPHRPDLRVKVIVDGVRVIDEKPFTYYWSTVTIDKGSSTIPGVTVSVKETRNGVLYENNVYHKEEEPKPIVSYINGETIIKYIPGSTIILDNGEVKIVPPSGVLVINDIVGVIDYYPPATS